MQGVLVQDYIRYVEILHNGIYPKRDTTQCPKKHHARRHAVSCFGTPICPYLRYELDTPENCANCAEDSGRYGDGGLWCHEHEEAGQTEGDDDGDKEEEESDGKKTEG